jgi:hypothetical protein
MEEVVCKVIADIAKYSPAKHGGCDMPIPIEYDVGELPKWVRKSEK